MKRSELVIASVLALVLAWNGYLAANGVDVLSRVVGVACVAFIAFVGGYRLAAYRELWSMQRVLDQLPSDITWHMDDDGRRHALVTTNGGDLRDVLLPAHIDNPDDALNYVVAQITE